MSALTTYLYLHVITLRIRLLHFADVEMMLVFMAV